MEKFGGYKENIPGKKSEDTPNERDIWQREMYLRHLGIIDPLNLTDGDREIIRKEEATAKMSPEEISAIHVEADGPIREGIIQEAIQERLRREEEIWKKDYILVSQDEELKRRWPNESDYVDNREQIIKEMYEKTKQKHSDDEYFFRKYPTYEAWRAFYYAKLSSFIVDHIEQNLMLNGYNEEALKSSKDIYAGGFIRHVEDYQGPYIVGHGPTTYLSKDIADEAMLVHAISRNALNMALVTGRLGERGKGQVSFSKDAVVIDGGFALVFKMSELNRAYDLFKITEDFRDYNIIDEYRSYFPVDMRLAVAVIPINEENFSDFSKRKYTSLATTRFGEKEIAELKEKYLNRPMGKAKEEEGKMADEMMSQLPGWKDKN